MNAELLGIYDAPSLTLMRARDLRDDFRKISDHFEERVMLSRSIEADDLYNSALGQILKSEQEIVEHTFKNIAKKMLSSKPEGIYQLEQRRATWLSLEYARESQGGGAMSHDDEIAQKSTGLLELLGQVLIALGDISGFEYRVESGEFHPDQPFQDVRILQLPAPDGHEPLACGGKYKSASFATDRAWSYYGFRWPVTCTDKQFLDAIRRIVVPSLDRHKRVDSSQSFSLFPLTDDSDLWNEGVIIYANDRILGASLEPILSNANWNLLRLDRIAKHIKRSISSNLESQVDIAVQQYRINTSLGDFVFDLEPVEGEPCRYLTVISHLNLSKQIGLLYKQTGSFFIIPSKFSEAVESTLNEFNNVSRANLNQETL